MVVAMPLIERVKLNSDLASNWNALRYLKQLHFAADIAWTRTLICNGQIEPLLHRRRYRQKYKSECLMQEDWVKTQ